MEANLGNLSTLTVAELRATFSETFMRVFDADSELRPLLDEIQSRGLITCIQIDHGDELHCDLVSLQERLGFAKGAAIKR
jgi:hypothetical protein